MKRIFFTALTAMLLLTLCLSSCGSDTVRDPFTDFYGDIVATCSVNVQGATSEIVFSRCRGAIKAEFTAPQALSGFVLSQGDQGFTMSYDDLTVPIRESAALILNLCKATFSPHYSAITDIQSEEIEGEKLTLITANDIIYTFTSNGEPKTISGTYEGKQFTVRINSLEPSESEKG